MPSARNPQVPTASPTAKTLPPIAPTAPVVQRTLGIEDSTPKLEQPVRAVSQPQAENSDGVPDRPRARTASGEIRVPGRRAPSIKPPVPEPHGDEDDESGPVMTIEVDSGPIITAEDETAPRKMVPVRKKKAKTDPPELAARAGEVELQTGPIRKGTVDEEPKIIIGDLDAHPTMAVTETSGELRASARPDPSAAAPSATIEVSEETSAGVVITEQPYRDSQPVLLERRRPSDQPTTQVPVVKKPIEPEPDDDDGEVIELAPKAKANSVRTPRHTVMGIGALPAATAARTHRDTEASGIPDALEDAPTGEQHVRDTDATIVTQAAPRIEDHTPTGDRLVAPPSPDDTDSGLAPPPAPTNHDPDVDDEVAAPPKPTPMKVDYDPLDDGWGPPGTTIPPPLLGAVPGSDDSGMGRIPVSNVEAAPLIVAPAVPPETARSGGAQTPARALEDASSRLIEVIRQLDHAETRDDIVRIMIGHLAETHTRAGFFVIKRDELSSYAIHPKPPTQPFGTLRLDRPSTFADIVGTRLPYRGPIPDEASRQFLTTVLGICPAEILLVPVAVRERVVGVLFGEARTRHTFDDQLGFASRAAGMALERILKAKRT